MGNTHSGGAHHHKISSAQCREDWTNNINNMRELRRVAGLVSPQQPTYVKRAADKNWLRIGIISSSSTATELPHHHPNSNIINTESVQNHHSSDAPASIIEKYYDVPFDVLMIVCSFLRLEELYSLMLGNSVCYKLVKLYLRQELYFEDADFVLNKICRLVSGSRSASACNANKALASTNVLSLTSAISSIGVNNSSNNNNNNYQTGSSSSNASYSLPVVVTCLNEWTNFSCVESYMQRIAEVLTDPNLLLERYLNLDFPKLWKAHMELDHITKSAISNMNQNNELFYRGIFSKFSNNNNNNNHNNSTAAVAATAGTHQIGKCWVSDLADVEFDLDEIAVEENKPQYSSLDDKLKVRLIITEGLGFAPEFVVAKKTFARALSPFSSSICSFSSPSLAGRRIRRESNGNDIVLHTAIAIGPWYLEWNESSLVFVKKVYGRGAMFLDDNDLCGFTRRVSTKEALPKIAKTIAYWNKHKIYDERKSNCQHFVDDILQTLGINLRELRGCSMALLIDRIRRDGFSPTEVPIAAPLNDFIEGLTNEMPKPTSRKNSNNNICCATATATTTITTSCISISITNNGSGGGGSGSGSSSCSSCDSVQQQQQQLLLLSSQSQQQQQQQQQQHCGLANNVSLKKAASSAAAPAKGSSGPATIIVRQLSLPFPKRRSLGGCGGCGGGGGGDEKVSSALGGASASASAYGSPSASTPQSPTTPRGGGGSGSIAAFLMRKGSAPSSPVSPPPPPPLTSSASFTIPTTTTTTTTTTTATSATASTTTTTTATRVQQPETSNSSSSSSNNNNNNNEQQPQQEVPSSFVWKSFTTHKELDEYALRCLERDPMIESHQRSFWDVLHCIDRSFWARHYYCVVDTMTMKKKKKKNAGNESGGNGSPAASSGSSSSSSSSSSNFSASGGPSAEQLYESLEMHTHSMDINESCPFQDPTNIRGVSKTWFS